jgi:hypothetical protein
MEATLSSETSVLARPTRRHIPEDGIIHSPLKTSNPKTEFIFVELSYD